MVTEKRGEYLLRLSLTIDPAEIGVFYPFLMQGFQVVVRVGCSIRELLCDQFGIDNEYVLGRITTVFQNGKAIDDLDAAIVRDGTRLTLSAAMPGLVGATMRRGGFYAAMRGSITHKETGESGLSGGGTITMKLFNLLLPELGPDFLKVGIGVAAADLADFFAKRPSTFWRGCRQLLLDGKPVEPERLMGGEAFFGEGTVWLSVTCWKEDKEPARN
ncbi:MAG: hypothetical protein FD174_599 [Geobacteraceae bacterium]|nr:MAG: hypothetical protein FD174_599 [Geobacteraceae bacterium]